MLIISLHRLVSSRVKFLGRLKSDEISIDKIRRYFGRVVSFHILLFCIALSQYFCTAFSSSFQF